jgi:WNK lysine deficient protein kinase
MNDVVVDDEDTVESDPTGRFHRYPQRVGRGRAKQVWKAFDALQGIDVAWSKVPLVGGDVENRRTRCRPVLLLDEEHPNFIRHYKTWIDEGDATLNVVTELFTSGDLRHYRMSHQNLNVKAIKRMARQILLGLSFMHGLGQPIVHTQLSCDHVYINGHSGEVKIGGTHVANASEVIESPSDNIRAFGFCLLELLTQRPLSAQERHGDCDDLMRREVIDPDSVRFVRRCLSDDPETTAMSLLYDPFWNASIEEKETSTRGRGRGLACRDCPCDEEGWTPGKLRGEDVEIELHGRWMRLGEEEEEEGEKDGSDKGRACRGRDVVHFRLEMGDAEATSKLITRRCEEKGEYARHRRPTIITFVYDPSLNDDAESVAQEIAETFELGATDCDLCASALREWLAVNGDGGYIVDRKTESEDGRE